MIVNQFNRKNPHRPTVSKGDIAGAWWVQGIDPNGRLHASLEWTLEAAHTVATGWAANGYPNKAAK